MPKGTAVVYKSGLPNSFVYTVGADASITRRVTIALDILGERLFDAPKLLASPYTDLGTSHTVTCEPASVYTPGTTHPNVTVINTDFKETNASLGLKVRAVKNLVLTGNVLMRLDNSGLRAKAVPLVGVSCSF